jgi:hypothetical protein
MKHALIAAAAAKLFGLPQWVRRLRRCCRERETLPDARDRPFFNLRLESFGLVAPLTPVMGNLNRKRVGVGLSARFRARESPTGAPCARQATLPPTTSTDLGFPDGAIPRGVSERSRAAASFERMTPALVLGPLPPVRRAWLCAGSDRDERSRLQNNETSVDPAVHGGTAWAATGAKV